MYKCKKKKKGNCKSFSNNFRVGTKIFIQFVSSSLSTLLHGFYPSSCTRAALRNAARRKLTATAVLRCNVPAEP